METKDILSKISNILISSALASIIFKVTIDKMFFNSVLKNTCNNEETHIYICSSIDIYYLHNHTS